MIRKIYHGSDHIIERPLYGAGKVYNDYGSGFYCTDSLEMAKEWAVGREKDGYANRYAIECEGLTILDLNSPDFTILHWLAVLLENRRFTINAPLALQARAYILSAFHVDYQDVDCMIGYRADDSYFSFAQDFISGTISYRQLTYTMHLGKLGQQFVLKSERAFDRIRFTGYETVLRSEWYAKRRMRDDSARRQYLDEERYRLRPGDLFITQILAEEMTGDDPRLRQDLS